MNKKSAFGIMYPIELMARAPIMLDWEALTPTLARRLGPVEIEERTETDRSYLLLNYPIKFQNFSAFAKLNFSFFDRKLETKKQSEYAEQALRQSSRFAAAEEVYRQCDHSLYMTSMNSELLDYLWRREIIVNGLLALLECTKIDLIHWVPTQQMLAPDRFREHYARPEALINPIIGFLNVRRFNIIASNGDMLIDTLGLYALGLRDFQIYFRGLPPDTVAQLMYDLGVSAFENGDVIGDGHTVEGINHERWTCQRGQWLIPPQREVINLNPGKPFDRGNPS